MRFLTAALRESYPEIWPTLLLIAGSMGLGAWKPEVALFAFTLSVPLLSGLSQTALLSCAQPLGLVFSALSLGVSIRNWRWTNDGKRDRENGMPMSYPAHSHLVSLITDLLITAVLLSLALQFWQHRDSSGLREAISDRSVFGYGDQFYFLTSAFLWLQGIFYYRVILTYDQYICAPSWTKPLFAFYFATISVFVLIQFSCGIPEGWSAAGFQSPYADISSFGSIAVAVFIFTIASTRWTPSRKLIMNCLHLSGLIIIVTISWSRATWLAGTVFLLLLSWLRFPYRVSLSIVIMVVATVLTINTNPDRQVFGQYEYISRLVALVRFEKITNKDPSRVELYRKAIRMIIERPLTGHRIGSFYLTSMQYASIGDPYASKPDFAHNIFLQMGAELGVPMVLLFAGLAGWTLWLGFRNWFKNNALGLGASNKALTILGISLALGAYLETGLTGNSLNVYISDQFFFWFLMAAVLAADQRECKRERESEGESESGMGKLRGIVSGSM